MALLCGPLPPRRKRPRLRPTRTGPALALTLPHAASCCLAGVHGCMVANAHKELRDWCEANGHDRIFAATQDGPGGIFEALHHFRRAAALLRLQVPEFCHNDRTMPALCLLPARASLALHVCRCTPTSCPCTAACLLFGAAALDHLLCAHDSTCSRLRAGGSWPACASFSSAMPTDLQSSLQQFLLRRCWAAWSQSCHPFAPTSAPAASQTRQRRTRYTAGRRCATSRPGRRSGATEPCRRTTPPARRT